MAFHHFQFPVRFRLARAAEVLVNRRLMNVIYWSYHYRLMSLDFLKKAVF